MYSCSTLALSVFLTEVSWDAQSGEPLTQSVDRKEAQHVFIYGLKKLKACARFLSWSLSFGCWETLEIKPGIKLKKFFLDLIPPSVTNDLWRGGFMKLKHLLIICRYFKATKNKLSVSSFIVSILFSEGLRLLMHSITLKRITLPSLLKGEVPLDINIKNYFHIICESPHTKTCNNVISKQDKLIVCEGIGWNHANSIHIKVQKLRLCILLFMLYRVHLTMLWF